MDMKKDKNTKHTSIFFFKILEINTAKPMGMAATVVTSRYFFFLELQRLSTKISKKKNHKTISYEYISIH